ncbi:MAG: BTAD domain-containing putative transcriptional regulator [Candidatus Dormibacteria bacterium]
MSTIPVIGREPELEMARGLLGCAPLVTVVAPAGAGKSALVRAVVSERRDVAWVDLHGLGPRAVLARVWRAAGFPGPATEHELPARLGTRSGLLVLDGVDGCATLCARLVAGMLPASGPTRVLVTAHQPLGLDGEVRWALGPLSLPPVHPSSTAEVLASGSGALMTRLLQVLNPRLDLDSRLVELLAPVLRQLGGSPLAIRLVAPLVAALGPQAVSNRLRPRRSGGEPEATVRVPAPLARALELSTRSLSPRQAEILSALAEFPAGIGVEHLGMVIAPAGGGDEGLEREMKELEERSLVGLHSRPTGASYRISWALASHLHHDSRWSAARRDAAQRRIAWSLSMVEGAGPSLLTGSREQTWLERLESEEDNLTASLEAAIEAEDTATAAQLGVEMWRFWELRGRLSEGRAWLTRILVMPRLDRAHRWKLLDGLGMLAWRQGDHLAAREAYREALREEHRSGGPEEARLLHHLGLVEAFANQPQEALRLLGLAVRGHLRAGELGQVAMVRSSTGLVLAACGRLEEARAQLEAALGTETVAQDSHAHAIALLHLGLVAALEERSSDSLSCLHRAGTALAALGDQRSAAYALLGLAAVLQAHDPATALTLATTATSAVERLGTPVPEPWASTVTAAMADAWAALGHDDAELAIQAAGKLSVGEAIATVAGRALGRAAENARGQVRVLGGFGVRWNGVPLQLTGQPAVLVKMLASSEGPLPTEAVMEELWPEADPRAGRWRLRNVLARLRRDASTLVVRGEEELDFGASVEVDSRQFLRRAGPALRQLRADDPLGPPAGRAALETYRGQLLPGELYAEWAQVARQRLAAVHVRLLDTLSKWESGHGDLEAAEAHLREAISEDPWDERRLLELTQLLRSTGRPLAALEALQRAMAHFHASGLRPSGPLLELVTELRAITDADPPARTPTLSGGPGPGSRPPAPTR